MGTRPPGEGSVSSDRYQSLTALLDAIGARARDEEGVSMSVIQDMAGANVFGPAILLPGLLAVSPLTGVPLVSSAIGAIVALVSAQLVLGRRDIWLPRRMAEAKLGAPGVGRALGFLRPLARGIDRVVKPRLAFATGAWAMRGAALICLLVAVAMPLMEIVPFLATAAGVVISTFGLAITLRDGALMIAGLAVFAGLIGGAGYLWIS